ncbi:MAG TPA: lipid II flippase MurJ, partial [Nocardioidaceae bacterium]|nr:lipid II flippase MurJ [Nocardioidaceae bacterium]
ATDAAGLPADAEAWLAWGTTAGVAVMTLPLLLPVARTGVRLRPTLSFPPGVARRAGALAGAGIATLLAQQASVLAVVKVSNSAGTTGTLNVFQYTQAVYLLPYAVLAVPLATAAFPRLSSRAATGDVAGYARTASATTRAVLLVALVGTVVLVAVAAPVAAFFERIDSGTVVNMGPALVAMAPGLLGFALIAHVGRALYALERGRAAATATVTGWVVVVVTMSAAAVLAAEPADVVVWLGAANSVGMTVAAVLLLVALRRAAGASSVAGVPRTLAGAGVAALAASVAGWWAGAALTDAFGAGALAAVGAGVAAAVVAAVVFAAGVVLLDRGSVREAAGLVRGKAS